MERCRCAACPLTCEHAHTEPPAAYPLFWAALLWALLASHRFLVATPGRPLHKDTFCPSLRSGLCSVHSSKVTLKTPVLILLLTFALIASP